MDDFQKEKIAEEVFKAGLGAISQVSEYAAKEMKSPKAIQVTQSITDALKNTDHTAKKGAELASWIAGGGAAALATGSTGAVATVTAAVTPFLPVVLVVGTGGLAAYGLYKVCEHFLDG